MYTFLSKGKDNGFRYPVTSQERTEQNLPPNEVDDNWDVISLESGETLSAIPKHTFPTSTKPSAFKLPDEILIGGQGPMGAMKTPMVKMRPFPTTDGDFAYPAPPNNNFEPTATPASISRCASLSAAIDATTAAAALAAAVGITIEDNDEFARFVQLAVANFQMQKSITQRSPPDAIEPPLSSQPPSMAAPDVAVPPSEPISFSPVTVPHEGSAAVPAASTPEAFSGSTAANAAELKADDASPPTAAQTPVYAAIVDGPSPTEGDGPSIVASDAVVADDNSESPSGAMNVEHADAAVAAESAEMAVVEIPLRWHTEPLPSPPVAAVGVAVTDTAIENVVDTAVAASTSSAGVRRPPGRRYRSAAGANATLSVALAAPTETALAAVGGGPARRDQDAVEASPDSVSGVLSPVARSLLLTPSPQLSKKAAAAAIDARFERHRRSMGPPRPIDEASVKTPARDANPSTTTSTAVDKTPIDEHNRVTLEAAVTEVAESKPPRPPRKRAHPPPPPPLQPASAPALSSSSSGSEHSHQPPQEKQAATSDDEGFVRGRKRSRREAELAMLLETTDAPKSRSRSRSHSHEPSRRQGSATSSSSSRPAAAAVSDEVAATVAAETSRNERRARSTSVGQQRDAFLGLWPSRKQSAATGFWRI
jgi:hypothetical protein